MNLDAGKKLVLWLESVQDEDFDTAISKWGKGKVPPRIVPKEIEELAGEEFVKKSKEAAEKLKPITSEALNEFKNGPEVSGEKDIEPK